MIASDLRYFIQNEYVDVGLVSTAGGNDKH